MNYVFVNGRVSLFDKAELTSQHIDEALFGMKCEILEESGEFYKVKTEYGYEGYVLKNTVECAEYEPDGIVIAPSTDVYPEARLYHAPLEVLPRGARVKLGKVCEDA